MTLQYDFHIHSMISDGIYKPEELVDLALKMKLQHIGITDHWGTTKYSDAFQVSDLEMYYQYLHDLKMTNREKLHVWIGLEIDFSDRYGLNPERYPCSVLNKFDYLLFENVGTLEDDTGVVNGWPLEKLLRMRDKLIPPIGLAHNNFQVNYRGSERQTIKAMKENNIFLELCEAEDKGLQTINKDILQQVLDYKRSEGRTADKSGFGFGGIARSRAMNAAGYRKRHCNEAGLYYFELFGEEMWHYIKEFELPVSVGSDSHRGKELAKGDILGGYIDKYCLEDQIVFVNPSIPAGQRE